METRGATPFRDWWICSTGIERSEHMKKERNMSLRIGIVVRRDREFLGMTQKDLAEKAEVSQAEISMIERGQRAKLSTLDCVSRALGKRLSELIRFAEEIGTPETLIAETRAFVQETRSKYEGPEKRKVKRPRPLQVRTA
jgi:transcriptional regulator with XRE-family HTH domain